MLLSCDMCSNCEYCDSDSSGIVCSILAPKPVIDNGKCSLYKEAHLKRDGRTGKRRKKTKII